MRFFFFLPPSAPELEGQNRPSFQPLFFWSVSILWAGLSGSRRTSASQILPVKTQTIEARNRRWLAWKSALSLFVCKFSSSFRSQSDHVLRTEKTRSRGRVRLQTWLKNDRICRKKTSGRRLEVHELLSDLLWAWEEPLVVHTPPEQPGGTFHS